jgi:hypothetical protein
VTIEVLGHQVVLKDLPRDVVEGIELVGVSTGISVQNTCAAQLRQLRVDVRAELIWLLHYG